MKRVKLHTGMIIEFPEKTSEEVIRRTVKRILGVEDGPKLEEVLSELASKIQAPDINIPEPKEFPKFPEIKFPEIKFPKFPEFPEQKDFYNPAMVKFGDKLTASLEKMNKNDRTQMTGSMNEIIKHIVNLTVQLSLMTDKIEEVGAMLSEAHEQNSKVISELVEVTRAPKTIIRDKDGKVKGIEL